MNRVATRFRPLRSIAAFSTIVVGLAIGCSTEPATGTVTGKVTLDGKAVASGTITFMSKTGNAPVAASIDTNGSYTATGVQIGDVMVSVVSLPDGPEGGNVIKKSGQETGKRSPPPEAPKNLLPARYADPGTSGLTTTVKEGTNQYDIPLTKG